MSYPEIHIQSNTKPRRIMHTAIEYFNGGYAWDFLTGCWHWQNGVCGGSGKDYNCWAKGLALGRNKASYPFGFEPTIYPSRLLDPLKIKKPSRIAVCFKGDLFGEWVDPEMLIKTGNGEFPLRKIVLTHVGACPEHTFLFLTKNPKGYQAWGAEWPDNCWLGATANDARSSLGVLRQLEAVKAKVKFLSLEPLCNRIGGAWLEEWLQGGIIQWVIIGGYSGGQRAPRTIEWVREIVEACTKAGVPVWLKNNLKLLIFRGPLFPEGLVNRKAVINQ